MKDIPYIAFEAAMARMDRIIKRLWIALLLVIVLLVASNSAWLYYESQFEDEVVTTTQTVTQHTDKGGNNDFVGGDKVGDTKSSNENR